MTLRTRSLLHVGALHVAFAALAVLAFGDRPVLLAGAELAFVVSLVVSARLVSAFFVPLDLVRTGSRLIREEDFTTRFAEVGQADMDELVRVYNHMIEQLREQRLRVREKHHFLDHLISASPSAIVTCDHDGRISSANPAAEALLGSPESDVLGLAVAELPEPFGSRLDEMAVGDSTVLRIGGRRLRALRAEFRDRGHARSFFLVEELTEELRRTERAAYEKLIRMVSHEVNNSVGAVGSLLASIRPFGEDLPPDRRTDHDRALEIAAGRLERLRDFVQGFAEFVRLPEPDRRPCDLAALLRDLKALHEPQLQGRRIRLELELSDVPHPPELDQNQLEQLLVNVIKNAAEAIGEGGTIRLRLGSEQGRAFLEVVDDGPGLDPSVRDQLFTPFLSTKAEGRGLGLTLVQEVAARHGWRCSLDGPPGGPTRFRLDFAPSAGRAARPE